MTKIEIRVWSALFDTLSCLSLRVNPDAYTSRLALYAALVRSSNRQAYRNILYLGAWVKHRDRTAAELQEFRDQIECMDIPIDAGGD